MTTFGTNFETSLAFKTVSHSLATMQVLFVVIACVLVDVAVCSRLPPLARLSLVSSTFHGEIPLAPVVDKLSVSRTIEIHSLIKDMEKSGIKVYSLAVGEPDFFPPKEVVEATAAAARMGITKYTAVTGEAKLREAIADDLNRRKGLHCKADQIVVSNGAKQSVLQALLSVVKPGSKVIVPSPYWTSYPDMVRLCQGEPVIAATLPEDRYNLRPETLSQILEEHKGEVSCLILCNPCNPSGCVPSRQHLLSLAAVLQQHPNVTVISDEIYERILFDGVTHTSFASLDSMRHRTVVISGPSKAYSMTGYRVGCSVSPPHIARALGKLQSQITSCASSIAQHATLAALTEVPQSWLDRQAADLQRKRDLSLNLLRGIPHLPCSVPQGAFYLFPQVSHYFGKKFTNREDGSTVTISNSFTLCRELLRAHHVALVPGEAFGMDDNVRLCFAADDETLKESINRLKQFLLALR